MTVRVRGRRPDQAVGRAEGVTPQLDRLPRIRYLSAALVKDAGHDGRLAVVDHLRRGLDRERLALGFLDRDRDRVRGRPLVARVASEQNAKLALARNTEATRDRVVRVPVDPAALDRPPTM